MPGRQEHGWFGSGTCEGAGSTTGGYIYRMPAQWWLSPVPEFLSKPPGGLIPRPPFEDFPTDPAKPPGPGWLWQGKPSSRPGDIDGNWYNPETRETLRPDMDHPPPLGRHWDYREPGRGRWWRWYPDGAMEPKA
jgi:Bacterial toxin 37